MLIIPAVCLIAQLPTVGFLYIAGWIGSVGRDYLVAARCEVQRPPHFLSILSVAEARRLLHAR